ncbi:MAG: M67 family metallopeptidase [Candidatus Bathyarchaeota archaeon]|nr:M67 family metallopeptidase [Candidatus Bathyarchaeota archaeon]
MILRIRSQHIDLLQEEARKVDPIEACALLFGEIVEDAVFVQKVVVTDNKLHSRKRFEISAETVVDSMAAAEREGLEFIGLFHSHTAPATPSQVDMGFMRLWGDAVWLILSLTSGELKAYQMKDGKVRKIIISVII